MACPPRQRVAASFAAAGGNISAHVSGLERTPPPLSPPLLGLVILLALLSPSALLRGGEGRLPALLAQEQISPQGEKEKGKFLAPQEVQKAIEALSKESAKARKSLQYAKIIEQYRQLIESIEDPYLRTQAGAEMEGLLGEYSLFKNLLDRARVRPDGFVLSSERSIIPEDEEHFTLLTPEGKFKQKWSALSAEEFHRLYSLLPLEADDLLNLAEFCLFRGMKEEGFGAVSRARKLDRDARFLSDVILARFFREEIPPGGYVEYEGTFLTVEERDRRLFMKKIKKGLESISEKDDTLSFQTIKSLERRDWESAKANLQRCGTKLKEALEKDYEAARTLLGSSRSSQLMEKRISLWKRLRAPREELIALINRYEKEEQGKVDERKRVLEELYNEYITLLATDELRLSRLSRLNAFRLVERIGENEEALQAANCLLESYLKAEPIPWIEPEETFPQGIQRHILPGREVSRLEEIHWVVLNFAAGKYLYVLRRGEELLRVLDTLTEWEQSILERAIFQSIMLFNSLRTATSAAFDELDCMGITNEYRALLGITPYIVDERVVRAARRHSQEMHDGNYFDHTSPVKEFASPTDRVRMEGYYGGAGENCAQGIGFNGWAAFNSWYHSPGHHRGMISPSLHIGVGRNREGGLWTMNMAGSDRGWQDLHPDPSPGLEAKVEKHFRGLRYEKTRKASLEKLEEGGLEALGLLARHCLNAAGSPQTDEHNAFPFLLECLARLAAKEELHLFVQAAIASLIEGLYSKEEIRAASNRALQRLTGEDHGFKATASLQERKDAVESWQRWWDKKREEFSLFMKDSPSVVHGEGEPDKRVPERKEADRSSWRPVILITEKSKLEGLKKFGGDKRTEAAVQRALRWLAKHQDRDGKWRGRGFVNHCGSKSCGGQGNGEHEIALTGLSLLCFLTAGNSPLEGPYSETVARGIRYLSKKLQDFGRFITTGSHYMYGHALATQALCDAYALTGDPELKGTAQLALNFIIFAQNPETGGWRYEPRESGDTSVTGWQMLALHSALKAGLNVVGLRGARKWFESVTEKAYYRVGYTSPHDDATRVPRLTAVGMVGRQIIGSPRNDPCLREGAFWLRKNLPDAKKVDMYYWYYATLAMFQMGGDDWKAWNKAMKEVLLEMQCMGKEECRYGSWDPKPPYGGSGGRIYSTALCSLMLEIYYRFDKFPERRSLRVTGGRKDIFVPYLERLGKGSEIDRALAMREIEEKFEEGAIPFLLQLMRSEPDVEVRRDISEIFLSVGNWVHIPLYAEFLRDPDPTVRHRIIKALGNIGHPDALPQLLPYLESRDPNDRYCAAQALERICDPKALPALLQAVPKEKDGGVAHMLQRAVQAITRRSSMKELLDHLPGIEPRERRALEEGLSVLSDGRDLILDILAQKGSKVFENYLKILSKYGRHSPIPVLILTLENKNPEVRTAAVHTLRRLSGQSFGFNPDKDPREQEKELEKWQEWWKESRKELFPEE